MKKIFSEINLRYVLYFLIAVLLVLGLFACKTSAEIPIVYGSITITEGMIAPVPEPPPPPDDSVPAPCQPLDVRFGNGSQDMVISSFQWGSTYQIEVRNISQTCSYFACFYWSVFDDNVLRWSGECCPFELDPGETRTIAVSIPTFEITPPPCTLAVLGIRVY
jgi:hypothetical protein